jgi:hypothetical protein
MTLQRIMFMNYGEDPITISITSRENVGVFLMLTEGELEELVDTHYLPVNETSDTWDLRVEAGTVMGFGVYEQLDFDDPNEETFEIVYANGKNPWPTPPPPPPPAYDRSEDFGTRYSHFLTALGVKAGQRPKRVRVSLNVPVSGRL